MFIKSIKVLVILCVLSVLPLLAQAASFNRIVVFGDSLSDNGNLFKVAGLPEEPYFEGRFSNGTIWVELLAKSLNLNETSQTQFADYAFGGAWAADADAQNGEGGLVPLSFERTLYFADYPAHSIDEKNTLFVIWIGNNDYLQDGRLNEDPHTVTTTTLNFISDHIEKLIDPVDGAGAKHFLILNLPDLGLTPKAKIAAANGHADYANNISLLSKIHNEQLTTWVANLAQKHPDVEFISFDLAAHFNDLIQQPEKYHIKDVTHPCYPDGIGKFDLPTRSAVKFKTLAIKNKTIDINSYADLMNFARLRQDDPQSTEYCANTNDYLFWDYVHPTALAHELIAQFALEKLAGKA